MAIFPLRVEEASVQLTHPNRTPVQLQIFVQDVITHTCMLDSNDILLAHSLCEMRLKQKMFSVIQK